jgi:hypothetical protein
MFAETAPSTSNYARDTVVITTVTYYIKTPADDVRSAIAKLS